MQTFLPDPDFETSARLLDDRRLGKQRVEALQVLRALTRETYGWKHHPAVRMWSGAEEALVAYGVAICREWRRRGYRDTVEGTLRRDADACGLPRPRTQRELARCGRLPRWLGDDEVHASHRAALVGKNPEHYGSHFPDVDPERQYVWPGAEQRATA